MLRSNWSIGGRSLVDLSTVKDNRLPRVMTTTCRISSSFSSSSFCLGLHFHVSNLPTARQSSTTVGKHSWLLCSCASMRPSVAWLAEQDFLPLPRFRMTRRDYRMRVCPEFGADPSPMLEDGGMTGVDRQPAKDSSIHSSNFISSQWPGMIYIAAQDQVPCEARSLRGHETIVMSVFVVSP